MYNIAPLPRSRKAPSPISLLGSKTEHANHAPGLRIGSCFNRDSFVTRPNSPNPATLNPLGPRTASCPPGYGAVCIGAPRTVRHSGGSGRFRCAMLAFIRDPFVTSYKWPDPVTLNALGMNNGLAPSSCRALCTGPPHTVRHSSVFGMRFAVLCSPSFATRS